MERKEEMERKIIIFLEKSEEEEMEREEIGRKRRRDGEKSQ